MMTFKPRLPRTPRFGRPSRLAVSGFAAGLLVTILAVATLAIAGGGDPPSGAPAGSLLPGTPSAPQGGKPVPPPDAGKVEAVGRFRILPVGSVPPLAPRFALPARDDITVPYPLVDLPSVERARAAGVAVVLPAPPRGFKIDFAEASQVRKPGGTSFTSSAFFRFVASDQFPVEVTVKRLLPGAVWYLVAYDASTGHAFSRVDIEGEPVLIIHGTPSATVQPAMQVYFTLGDYWVYVDAPALPVDILTEFVTAWIRDHKGTYGPATAPQGGTAEGSTQSPGAAATASTRN